MLRHRHFCLNGRSHGHRSDEDDRANRTKGGQPTFHRIKLARRLIELGAPKDFGYHGVTPYCELVGE